MMSRVSVLVTHEDSDSAQHLNLPCVDSFNPTSLDAIAEGIVEGLKCYGDLWDLLPDDIIFYSLTTPVPDIIITSSLREYLQNLDLRSSAATLFRSWSIPQDRQLLAVCSFARRRIESPAIEQVATQHSVEQVIRSIRSRDTPSTEAKNAKLLAVQKREVPDAAYARRPLSLDGPPITIYSPVFSKFRHLAETVDLTAKEIGDTFDFVTASTEYYEDEQSRSEAIRYLLRALVDGKFLEKGYINYGQRQAELDGFSTHIFGLLMAAKGIHEMNNGLGEGSSDALEQAICDFKAFCACNDGERLHARCCCPMFLVAIEGAYICVAGAVFTDRIIVERFTDYIFVGSSPQISGSNAIDEGIRRIGKILKALKICYQEHLPAFYDALPFPPSPASSLATACCPHLRQSTLDGVVYELSYQRLLAARKSSRAVFEATLKSPTISKRVVVKFTHSYGAAAHEILAAHSPPYAPNLLYYQRHADVGGLLVVIMDWWPVFPVEKLTPLAETRLREAISLLHTADLVFGDLRPSNIMLNGNDIAIIDFDWAGKEGEAAYPIIINLNAITWPSGVVRGGLIRRDHDLAMLESSIAELAGENSLMRG